MQNYILWIDQHKKESVSLCDDLLCMAQCASRKEEKEKCVSMQASTLAADTYSNIYLSFGYPPGKAQRVRNDAKSVLQEGDFSLNHQIMTEFKSSGCF